MTRVGRLPSTATEWAILRPLIVTDIVYLLARATLLNFPRPTNNLLDHS